jgi:hypothetical protein
MNVNRMYKCVLQIPKKQKKTNICDGRNSCRLSKQSVELKRKKEKKKKCDRPHTHTLFTGRCLINNLSKEWLFFSFIYIYKKKLFSRRNRRYTLKKKKSVDIILFFKSTCRWWSSGICPNRQLLFGIIWCWLWWLYLMDIFRCSSIYTYHNRKINESIN